MKAWYCAYTQPCMELWARANLWERGLEVYLPLYRRRRSHARRVDWVSAPLFPRYLFVAADLEAGERRRIVSHPSIHFPRSVYLPSFQTAADGFSKFSFGAKNSSFA